MIEQHMHIHAVFCDLLFPFTLHTNYVHHFCTTLANSKLCKYNVYTAAVQIVHLLLQPVIYCYFSSFPILTFPCLHYQKKNKLRRPVFTSTFHYVFISKQWNSILYYVCSM